MQSSCDRAVLDRQDFAHAGADFPHNAEIQRFEETHVVVQDGDSAAGGHLSGFGGNVPYGTYGQQGDVAAVAEQLALSYGNRHEVDAAPGDALAVPAGIPYYNRTLHVGKGSRVHEVAQLQLVERGCDDKVRNGAVGGQVEDSVVRGSVLADQTGSVKAEDHLEILQGNVVDDIVVGSLHEGGVDIAEGQHAGCGHTCRECHCVLLRYAHIEGPFGYFLHHDVHAAAGGHGRGDGDYLLVCPCEFQQGLSEYVLVAGGLPFGRDVPLAGDGVECAGGMPYCLVFLGRAVALAFLGDYVKELGALDVAQGGQGGGQLADVVAVDGPEVAEAEGFEERAAPEDGHFGTEHYFLNPAAEPGGADRVPDVVLDAVVRPGGGDLQKVVVQSAVPLVYGDVVVVENDQNVCLHGPGVVESLEGHSSGHGTVADDRYNFLIAARDPGGYGHAEGGTDRGGRMAYAESVEDAFGHFRKTADPLVGAVCLEALAAACDDLVGIGLVTHVPDYFVNRSVVDIMQGYGEFYGTEAGSEMARIGGAALYHIPADLAAEGLKLFDREAPDVFGAVYLFQKGHRVLLPEDGLLSVGPEGDDGDGYSCFLFNISDVFLEFCGEVSLVPNLREAAFPAFELPVDRDDFRVGVEGYAVLALAVDDISLSHLDGVKGVHHIGLHHDQGCDSVEHYGVLEGYHVQPAGAAGTARSGAELVALAAELLTCLIEELSGEGTAAYAGAVGLEDAVDVAYRGRSYAEAEAGSRAGSGRGGHERVGAEIHVEHRTLGSFCEDAAAVAEAVVDIVFAVYEVKGTQVVHGGHPFLDIGVRVVGIIELFEECDVFLFQGVKAGLKVRGQDVPDAEAVAAGLVHVGGADALEGGADLGFAFGCLGGRVYDTVGGGDQVGFLGDSDPLPYGNAQLFDLGALLLEDYGVEDYASADDVVRAFSEDTRGYRVKHEAAAFRLDGMAGIGTALEPGNDIVLAGEDVHNFAFALISPLETEDHVYFCFILVHGVVVCYGICQNGRSSPASSPPEGCCEGDCQFCSCWYGWG